ncbi:TolC family protein [Acidicapsa ligni]|uniref:TolC family protein n=1 Tax=Acidicapsa ligni TaxID=542300 RepID=UPI0021E03B50|nr:TolC family protein [Acidicapsa ligni]
MSTQLAADSQPSWSIDPIKIYTLPELIDLAELHNPETRAAWERVRLRADELGIARSAYYPTLVATGFAASDRQPALIGEYLHRQTIDVVRPALHVEYLVFDMGGRSGEVDVAKANLLIQGMEFNNTHRRLIYRVASAYFHLLNAKGQRAAAEISLQNAETVEADTESCLKNGLATQPDLLEASAARAQADYDLQATIGNEEIAHSELSTTMGLPAEAQFHVQSISDIPLPTAAADSLDQEIERAFKQRPELLADIARIRSAQGDLKQARSAYLPSLHLAGDGGLARGYAQQDLYPGHYAEGEVWSAGLEMRWTLFDGARREKRVAAANAEKRVAESDLHAQRDQIEQEVFMSYTNLRTALRQQQAATALLTASSQSYEAARQSYSFGLRNQLDVISAQKVLAQALSENVTAQSQLLLQVADLAFRTADMIQVETQTPKP